MEKKWQKASVILHGDSHGQTNVVGSVSWGFKELDITQQLSMHTLLMAQKIKDESEHVTVPNSKKNVKKKDTKEENDISEL